MLEEERRIWQMSWEVSSGVEQCHCGLGDTSMGCWRGDPMRSICIVQLYLKVLQETILVGFPITHRNESTCSFAALQMRWCHGIGTRSDSVENCPFWYPESPKCPSLSSKESTGNCMLKYLWGNGKTSVSITGPIWNFSSRRWCSSQRCDLLCHCSWHPSFLAPWHLPGSSADDSLLLWIPWDCSQNFPCVFSLVYTGISFILLKQLDIPQRHTFIKAVSMQLLIPAINPSVPNYPVANPTESALIPSQILCLDGLCPAFLAGWGLFSGDQSQSPSWLRGSFRPRAEKAPPAAALLSLKFRFLAMARCGTTKFNCFRTQSVLAPTQAEWGAAKKVPPVDPLGTGCSRSAQRGFQDRKNLPVKIGFTVYLASHFL